MNEDDSLWKKWHVRVTTIAGLLAILTFLFTWSPKVRNMMGIFLDNQPVAPIVTPEPQKPVVTVKPVEPQLLTKGPPNQYLNTAILRREGIREVAILVRQESGESLPNLESAIASLLTKRGLEPVQSFFKPAFIQEGQAKSLFDGNWTVSEQLQLGRRVDYVLIGFGKVTYSPNQELGGLLTANFELELKCLNVVSQRVCDSKTLIPVTPGAGYTQSAALQSAVEHLQQQLESFVREAF